VCERESVNVWVCVCVVCVSVVCVCVLSSRRNSIPIEKAKLRPKRFLCPVTSVCVCLFECVCVFERERAISSSSGVAAD